MAKGGSESKVQTTTMPTFMETAIQQGIGMGTDLGNAPYAAYRGPDVAAFSPLQNASFQATDQMSSAFGMPTTGGANYMPAPVQAGGAMGYSAAPVYDQAVNNLEAPVREFYSSFGIDPNTGAVGERSPDGQLPVVLEMQSSGRGGGK
tara:strand:+ start:7337 stop:7780 length:444 start_codon:yes stop_codon:yes gene_type:complete